MSERERFLSGFSPLPADFVLPERIARDYDVESCLRCREDGGFALRLRRRSDRASFVLKVSAQGMEDLEDEFRILTRLGPLLPGAVPAAADCFQEGGMGYLLRAYLPGRPCWNIGSGRAAVRRRNVSALANSFALCWIFCITKHPR